MVATKRIAGGLFFLLIVLLFSFPVFGATIRGAVYDLYLDQLHKAIVSIDTEPTQTMVSKGGVYRFQVPPGHYTLLAVYDENGTTYSAKERISITDEGEYVIDLILVPELEGDDTIDNLTQTEFVPFEQETSPVGFIITLSMILFFLLYIILTKAHFLGEEEPSLEHKTAQPAQVKVEEVKIEQPAVQEEMKEESADDVDKLLGFIKEQGGRVTQKEIRKRFPLSEAKVSLILADLESQGKVKKIKKGRSNIIILNE